MAPQYFKIGDRVQRVGWQLEAQGTIRDCKLIGLHDGTPSYYRWLYVVEWDFRGIEKDLTTIWQEDIAPVINWAL